MSRTPRHNRVVGDERRITVVGWPRKEGFLLDISEHGAGVVFSFEQEMSLAVGQDVALNLEVEGLKKGLLLQGQVRHRREMRDDRRYGIQFSGLDGLTSKEMQVFRKMVNRRQAFRVLPIVGDSVVVHVGLDPKFGASALNISATGIGIVVSLGAESALMDQTKIALSIQIGQITEPIQLQGLVRNRTIAANGVRYGVQFDPEDLSYLRNQEVLQNYIMECQRVWLTRR